MYIRSRHSIIKQLTTITFGVLVIVATFIYTHAYAAQGSTTDNTLMREFDQLYEQLLNEPDNIELTTRYADIAVRMKDYEAAIPALDRKSVV